MLFEKKSKSYIEETNSLMNYANQLGISAHDFERLISQTTIGINNDCDMEAYNACLSKIKLVIKDEQYFDKIKSLMSFMKDYGKFKIEGNTFSGKFEKQIYDEIEYIDTVIYFDDNNVNYATFGTLTTVELNGSFVKKEDGSAIRETITRYERVCNEHDNNIITKLVIEEVDHKFDINDVEFLYNKNMSVKTWLIKKQQSSSEAMEPLNKVYFDGHMYSNYQESLSRRRIDQYIVETRQEIYDDPKYQDRSLTHTFVGKCKNFEDKRIPLKPKYEMVSENELEDLDVVSKTR